MRRKSLPQTFSITFEQWQRLTAVCERLHISKSAILQESIEDVLQRFETRAEREAATGRETASAGGRSAPRQRQS